MYRSRVAPLPLFPSFHSFRFFYLVLLYSCTLVRWDASLSLSLSLCIFVVWLTDWIWPEVPPPILFDDVSLLLRFVHCKHWGGGHRLFTLRTAVGIAAFGCLAPAFSTRFPSARALPPFDPHGRRLTWFSLFCFVCFLFVCFLFVCLNKLRKNEIMFRVFVSLRCLFSLSLVLPPV